MLYQLSYFRIVMNLFGEKCDEDGTRTHTSQLTLPPQSSASTNSATSPTHHKIVPRTGLEPARLAAHAPETCASTNSATWALYYILFFYLKVFKELVHPSRMRLQRYCFFLNWQIFLRQICNFLRFLKKKSPKTASTLPKKGRPSAPGADALPLLSPSCHGSPRSRILSASPAARPHAAGRWRDGGCR